MMCVRPFFFFKQKTAYEVRISDWSSDVCSSDLRDGAQVREQDCPWRGSFRRPCGRRPAGSETEPRAARTRRRQQPLPARRARTEEGHAGKEGGRTGTSRWRADAEKKKKA